MKKQIDLTKGNIAKGILLFGLPLFFGSLFQQLYGTADVIFVSRILGKNAAAAVGAGSILVTCLIGLFTGISVGTGVVVANGFGSKNEARMKKAMQSAVLIGLAGGILLMAAGLIFSEKILSWMHTPEEIMANAPIYIRIYFAAIPMMILYNICAGILRAIGNVRLPFWVLAGGGVLNVMIDAIFLKYLHLGIAGAAFATLISQDVTAVVLLVFIIRNEKIFVIRLTLDWEIIGSILKIGIPSGIQSVLLTLSNLIGQYHINKLGEDSIAAFTIYFKAENVIYMPILAFGQVMLTFTGQNIGAFNMQRVKKGVVQCNLLSVAVTLCLAGLFTVFPSFLLEIFSKEKEINKLVLEIIQITFPCYFIYSIMEVTSSAVRGMGKALPSLVIMLLALCGSRILLIQWVTQYWNSVRAVAAVYPVTWLIAVICFLGYYHYCSIYACND